MRLPNISGEFRLVDDPELRFTPNGKAVTNVRLVASESKRNAADDGWEDGDRVFLNASVWNQGQGTQAEDVAESFRKGQRVLVTGQLYVREYETRDGGKGQSAEVKWATIAAIPGGKPKGERSSAPAQSSQPDPWATPSTPAGNPDPWA